METMWVVPAFDVAEDLLLCLGRGGEVHAIDELALQRGEEALTHGVVAAVADASHRRTHTFILAALAEGNRGVLRALIGVVDDLLGPPLRNRHVQRPHP